MNESSKTRAARPEWFYRRYASGLVLDIGCGRDLCVPHAVHFDVEQGDANHALDYFDPESFDCVHSSHCLEHMRDPRQCLRDWWTIVKPGGYLITVVPDEDRYEQGIWPSLFNPDHKHTFRLDGAESWSPVSWNLRELIGSLPGASIVSAAVQHSNQPVRIFGGGPTSLRWALSRTRWLLYRADLTGSWLDRAISATALHLNCPVDRTLGRVLAQIEVVARKGGG